MHAWPFSDFSYEATLQKTERYLLGVRFHAKLGRQRSAASAFASVSDLPSQIPGVQVGFGGVLKSPAGRKQQVIVFVDVVTASEIEAGAIDAINLVRGLMKNLPAERQFFRIFRRSNQPVYQ